jgi:hypothetical protein
LRKVDGSHSWQNIQSKDSATVSRPHVGLPRFAEARGPVLDILRELNHGLNHTQSGAAGQYPN